MAHICVADDDGPVRATLRILLETWGHTVIEAAYGEEAVEIVRRERPDLVVLDYRMPAGDGIWVAGELSAFPETRDIPIVMVSGAMDRRTRDKALSLGVRAVLDKPWDDGELSKLVDRLLAA